MARAAVLLVTALLVLMAVSGSSGAPWLDFFTNYRPRAQYPQWRPPNPGGTRSGRDRFKAICRTINPDSYAFPGRAPFPAAPVCPY